MFDRRFFSKLKSLVLVGTLLPVNGIGKENKEVNERPKLLIVLVVDQLRSDTYLRHKSALLPKEKKGYRFLIETGAYFPLADQGLFQNVTCPGHAQILTGAPPRQNGIVGNSFYDRGSKKPSYCAEDPKVKLIGVDNEAGGRQRSVSPVNLWSSTLGDELRIWTEDSEVVSISLKDRSAVMLGGLRPNHVFWISESPNIGKSRWVTSSYYEDKLPEFVVQENVKLADLKENGWDLLASETGLKLTFGLAKKAVENFALGKKGRDLLALSISGHDIVGHKFGSESNEASNMFLAEDRAIADFLTFLDQKIGLQNVAILLTSDHGAPPSVKKLQGMGIPSGIIDEKKWAEELNAFLKTEFGFKEDPVQSLESLQIVLKEEVLQSRKVDSNRLREKMEQFFEKKNEVQALISRETLAKGNWPAGNVGEQLKRSFVESRSPDFWIQPKAFYYNSPQSWLTINHITGYSYDRYVPAVLWGRQFRAGQYRQIISILDLAPTLSAVMGVTPPSHSEGRVLSEALVQK